MITHAISCTFDIVEYDQFQHITMQQLEALVHLVTEGNFSRAACRMGLSQPSISKHIKNLELFIDATIIDRTVPGISLTAEGRIIHGYAKRILRLREEAREKMVHTRDTPSHIFIGASTIPATYILPSVISALKGIHPSIMVHIHSGDSNEVLEMVRNDQIELGFIGKGIQERKLMCESLWKDTLILVAHKDHPLAASPGVSVKELGNLPFVGREKGSGTRATMEEHLRAAVGEMRLTIVCEMGSSEAVKEAVIAGMGVSIISMHAIKRELDQGILVAVPLRGFNLERQFSMIYKRQFKPLTQHRLFMDFARSYRP